MEIQSTKHIREDQFVINGQKTIPIPPQRCFRCFALKILFQSVNAKNIFIYNNFSTFLILSSFSNSESIDADRKMNNSYSIHSYDALFLVIQKCIVLIPILSYAPPSINPKKFVRLLLIFSQQVDSKYDRMKLLAYHCGCLIELITQDRSLYSIQKLQLKISKTFHNSGKIY